MKYTLCLPFFFKLSTTLSLWQFTKVTRKVLQNRLFMFHLKGMTNELFYYSLRCVCTSYKVHNTIYTLYKVLFSQSLRAPLKFIENPIQMNVLYPSIICLFSAKKSMIFGKLFWGMLIHYTPNFQYSSFFVVIAQFGLDQFYHFCDTVIIPWLIPLQFLRFVDESVFQ